MLDKHEKGAGGTMVGQVHFSTKVKRPGAALQSHKPQDRSCHTTDLQAGSMGKRTQAFCTYAYDCLEDCGDSS